MLPFPPAGREALEGIQAASRPGLSRVGELGLELVLCTSRAGWTPRFGHLPWVGLSSRTLHSQILDSATLQMGFFPSVCGPGETLCTPLLSWRHLCSRIPLPWLPGIMRRRRRCSSSAPSTPHLDQRAAGEGHFPSWLPGKGSLISPRHLLSLPGHIPKTEPDQK